jgi:hypothetical protein
LQLPESKERACIVKINLNAVVEILERHIDAHGPESICECLEGIFAGKADHVRTNWQDERLAKEWEVAHDIVCRAALQLRHLNIPH